MKYKHLFFDLDRTLWDFDKSSMETFTDIFENRKLKDLGIESVEIFHDVYEVHNNKLWDLYRNGGIAKEVLRGRRFYLTLKDFGIDDPELAEAIGMDYVTQSPLKVNLFPAVLETLEYLYPKYKLHIITNGFQEVQDVKMEASGLMGYFDTVVTSEEAGIKKPNEEIFYYALRKAGAEASESLMIGDDPDVDILGAKKVGIDQVLFDPNAKFVINSATYYVTCLNELTTIL